MSSFCALKEEMNLQLLKNDFMNTILVQLGVVKQKV